MIIGHESLLALRRRICDLVMSHNHRSRSCALILRHGHRQRFRIFFPGKDTETLTHFFLDFWYFFFRIRKKNTFQKFQIIKVWAENPYQNDKKMFLWVKITNAHHAIWCHRVFFSCKWWSRIYYAYFIFEKVGSGTKKYRYFY